MEENRIKTLAEMLLAAEQTCKAMAPITETDPQITIDEAYRIQLRVMEMKKAVGQIVVGKKIGLTSLAMQAMLGVKEPDYGHVLNGMVVMEAEKIP
ncbi:MAG: 2-keto-4-pentenoate hydratase, partial [Deltaproteobacteria bacterium]